MSGEQVEASSGGKSAKTSDVLYKPRSGDLTVPFAEISTLEGIATGFRQHMLGLADEKGGEEIGSVSSGAGLGSDFITLTWKDKTAVVRGIDLLRAWVSGFDPKAAGEFPEGLGEAASPGGLPPSPPPGAEK
jgi:hypothetical protein